MNDPIFISTSDLKNLYHRLKQKIKVAALIGAFLVLGFRLIQTPQYVAEATFKQSSGKLEQNYDLRNLFRTFVAQDSESSAMSLMLSHQLLQHAIESLGWQASVGVATSSKFLDNIKIELGLPISDPDPFLFKDVHYNGDKPKSFFLRFDSLESYEILNLKKHSLCNGSLGKKVEVEDIVFTLDKIPKNFKKEALYHLTILPIRDVTGAVKSQFTIKNSLLDHSVLCLTYRDRNRKRATAFLSQIMIAYQNYLRDANLALADAQLKYLEKRQEELNVKFEKTLQDHVAYLKQTVGNTGFIGIHQAIEILSEPHEAYTTKLFDIDFEISHLNTENYSPTNLEQNYLHQKIDPINYEYKKVVTYQSEQTQNELTEALSLLDQLEKNEELLKPRNPTFASLITRLQTASDSITALEAKNRLTSHLRDFIQSLHLKQKILEEETSYAKTLESDLRGLDLDQARALHVQYHTGLDQLHTGLKQLLYLRDHIDNPECEFGSLASLAPDSITQEMVYKASQIELQLQDALNRSEKEHQRFREALALQRHCIANHLSHTIEMQKIRAELTKEKIASLQQLMLDLLKTEKRLIEKKLQELKEQMSDLPEKWHLENLLKLKTDLAKGMMEGLTHLTESKVLSRYLYNVESSPLDSPFSPLSPKPPRLLFFAFIGAFLGALFVYLTGFVRDLIRGFPVTLENLKFLGEHISGILSPLCDISFSEISQKDLETLRHAADFLNEQKPSSLGIRVALLGEKNSNFSSNLAAILTLRGKKSIILDCNFEGVVLKEDVPGLWHYLSEETPELNIRHFPDFDSVPSGGATRHATELFTKNRFSALLLDLQSRYDFVFMINRAPLSSTEALQLSRHSDVSVICCVDEPLNALCSYRQLPGQKERQNVTFIQQNIYMT